MLGRDPHQRLSLEAHPRVESSLTPHSFSLVLSFVLPRMLLAGHCPWTVVAAGKLPLWAATGAREGQFQQAAAMGKTPNFGG